MALGEPGYVIVIRDSGATTTDIRKVKKLDRTGGFYVSQSFAGKSERIDALNVAATVDLGALEAPNLKDPDDIAAAKALESRTRTALKQYPLMAPHLTAALTQLRSDIERAERGERKIAGAWISSENVAAPKRSTINRGTLFLKNGTAYHDVDIVSANSRELRITHSSGVATVPLSQVPEEFIKKNLPSVAPAPAKPDQ